MSSWCYGKGNLPNKKQTSIKRCFCPTVMSIVSGDREAGWSPGFSSDPHCSVLSYNLFQFMVKPHCTCQHESSMPLNVYLGVNRGYQKQLWSKAHLLNSPCLSKFLKPQPKPVFRPDHSTLPGNAFSQEGLTRSSFPLFWEERGSHPLRMRAQTGERGGE